MGLFQNYDRAPDYDLPRKEGFGRLIEILVQDFWRLFAAGLLALLGAVPFLFGLSFAIAAHALVFAIAAGLLGGLIAGPQLAGLCDTILRALRNEPGFWWHTYRRTWKRNLRQCLAPGALLGLLFGLQIFFLCHIDSLTMTGPTLVALLIGTLVTVGIALYVWPQVALMDLPFLRMLKNAALLFLAQLPRSLGALGVTAGYCIVMLIFYPYTIGFAPLTSLWLPALPALFLIYPGMNQSFAIEETLARRAAGLPDQVPEAPEAPADAGSPGEG